MSEATALQKVEPMQAAAVSDEKPKPKEPPAKLDTDPDVNTPTVCLSNVLELRRLAFLIAHEEGFKALQELFDRIESELCK